MKSLVTTDSEIYVNRHEDHVVFVALAGLVVVGLALLDRDVEHETRHANVLHPQRLRPSLQRSAQLAAKMRLVFVEVSMRMW